MPVNVGCVRVRELPNCTDLQVQNAIQHMFPAKAQRCNVKLNKRLTLLLCAFAGNCFVLLCVGVVSVQGSVRSRVTISITKPSEIKIDAELSRPVNSWSFRNAYAGVLKA